jgi:hypothetical protein
MEAVLNEVIQAVLGGNGDSAAATARAEIGWGSVRLTVLKLMLMYWSRVTALGSDFPVHCLLRARMEGHLQGEFSCCVCERFASAAVELWGLGGQARLLGAVDDSQPERNTAKLKFDESVQSAVQDAIQREFVADCMTTEAGKRYLSFKSSSSFAKYLEVVRRMRIWRASPEVELLVGLRTGDHELRSARYQRGVHGDGLCECGASETPEHFLFGCPFNEEDCNQLCVDLEGATFASLRELGEWDKFVRVMQWLDCVGVSEHALELIVDLLLKHVQLVSAGRRRRMRVGKGGGAQGE